MLACSAVALFIFVIILTIFGNSVWPKKLTEILFIVISYIAIQSFLKALRKK